jgi:Cu-Zn family superoxide dismutase
MPTMNSRFLPFALGALGALAACGAKTTSTTATLANPTGQMVGSVMFSQTGLTNPVSVTISVTGLPAGPHGVHVHDMGKCDPPDFMTAGGHFNPTSALHGDPASAVHHTGDLGNLQVGTDGAGTLSAMSTAMSLDPANIGYVSGHAFIVHANPDDFSQPTGNAGGRIACGLIPPPQ